MRRAVRAEGCSWSPLCVRGQAALTEHTPGHREQVSPSPACHSSALSRAAGGCVTAHSACPCEEPSPVPQKSRPRPEDSDAGCRGGDGAVRLSAALDVCFQPGAQLQSGSRPVRGLLEPD